MTDTSSQFSSPSRFSSVSNLVISERLRRRVRGGVQGCH